MNKSDKEFFAPDFSHIYVEEEALKYDVTKDIMDRFSGAVTVPIHHYKDVFNRTHQNFFLQKQSTSLILAVKHGELIYPGADVCQSFGNEHFYYTSNVMNCIFDCEYCYLQGMYPSGNMVIFVNQEDIFRETDRLLSEHSVYLCVSYDTDLLAIEDITGFVAKWTDFAASRPSLKIEIRTKSAYTKGFEHFSQAKNIIFAWTLSPEEVIAEYEHKTPNLDTRIKALSCAIANGYTTRLCFDPMLRIKDYQKIYSKMFRKVFKSINADKILDISIGTFRISADYLKNMRKQRLGKITSYPYSNISGVSGYESVLVKEMLDFAESEIRKYTTDTGIYRT